MLKRLSVIMMLMALCWAALAVEQRHGILVGVVLRLDAAAQTVVVKLADGTEHAFHFVKRTTVHGAQGSAALARDAFHGLKEGSEVAVHYTAKGTEETYRLTDSAAKDAGKDIAEGAEKSAKVTVYYTEEAGHKVAHFFKRAV